MSEATKLGRVVIGISGGDISIVLMMADRRNDESSATLKNILDDLLSNNTDEEIKFLLSQLVNVEETVGNIKYKNILKKSNHHK